MFACGGKQRYNRFRCINLWYSCVCFLSRLVIFIWILDGCGTSSYKVERSLVITCSTFVNLESSIINTSFFIVIFQHGSFVNLPDIDRIFVLRPCCLGKRIYQSGKEWVCQLWKHDLITTCKFLQTIKCPLVVTGGSFLTSLVNKLGYLPNTFCTYNVQNMSKKNRGKNLFPKSLPRISLIISIL